MYKVFVKTDEKGRIIDINSNAFLRSVEGWQEIDCGNGDKYHHAQHNYFLKPLINDKGLFNYVLKDGKPQERSEEDKEAEYIPPVVKESIADRLEKLEAIINIIKKLVGVKD